MGILLITIGCYSINDYWWILVFINGYWWIFCLWILVAILLMVIGGYLFVDTCGYFINGYW
jgi:hypothetical protein